MIKLSKNWYITWPINKLKEIPIDLPEKMYEAVVDSMIAKDRGVMLECSYCKQRLAYVVILRKYENFPVVCTACLVGA